MIKSHCISELLTKSTCNLVSIITDTCNIKIHVISQINHDIKSHCIIIQVQLYQSKVHDLTKLLYTS